VLVSSYISPKAVKGLDSSIEGRGLIAVAPISAGEVVAIKGGHIIDTATLNSLPERLRESDVQIADGLHLAALEDAEFEPVMLFLNHSCEPNVGFCGNIVLVAMRDIAEGEELSTDYALFDDYEGEMECRCQAPSCRGTIGGRDWQRPELQRKYGGYFASYLLRRITDRTE
jgi:SET domain-containing protein